MNNQSTEKLNLISKGILEGNIGIASTKETIVGYDYHLKHVIVKCKRQSSLFNAGIATAPLEFPTHPASASRSGSQSFALE